MTTTKIIPPHQGCEIRRHLWLLIGLYSAAHLPLLAFTKARFWDDWSIYDADPNTLIGVFRQAGNTWVAYMHIAIQSVGWWPYPLLVFAAYLVTVIGAYRIALKLGIDPAASFWIAAIFAVIPVNFARIAAIDLPYGLSLAVFMLAWLLLLTPPQKGLVIWRSLVLAGFAFSFTAGSMLVLYAAPIGTYLLVRWKATGGRHLADVAPIVGRSVDLVVLPVIFWAMRSVYFRPEGMFAGYNSMDLGPAVFGRSLLPLLEFFGGGGMAVAPSGLVAIMAVVLFIPEYALSRIPSLPDRMFHRSLTIAFAGVGLAYLGAFPYLAVGKMPSFTDWMATRHQLALAIGLAVAVYGILEAGVGRHAGPRAPMRVYLPLFLVFVFVVNWWMVYAEFYVDHLWQRAFVSAIRERTEFTHGNFIVEDATGLAAFDAPAGFNEYAGLHALVYTSHDALILDYRSVKKLGGWRRFFETYRRYLGAWTKTNAVNPSATPSLYILTSRSRIESKVTFAAKMLTLRLLRPAREQQIIRQMLVIDGPFVPGVSRGSDKDR